jgi:hypothetical protein
MIEAEEWRKIIKETVYYISSKECQKQHWFNPTGLIIDPDELYEQLFGDYTFELFLEDGSVGLDNKQKQLGYGLCKLMEDYSKDHISSFDVNEMFMIPIGIRFEMQQKNSMIRSNNSVLYIENFY